MSNVLPFFLQLWSHLLTLWEFSSEIPNATKKGKKEKKRTVTFGGGSPTSVPPLSLRSLFPSLPRWEISAPAQWHWKDPDTGGKPHSGKGHKGKEGDCKLVFLQFIPSLVKASFLLISLFFKSCGLLGVQVLQERGWRGPADSIWRCPRPSARPPAAHPILLLLAQGS